MKLDESEVVDLMFKLWESGVYSGVESDHATARIFLNLLENITGKDLGLSEIANLKDLETELNRLRRKQRDKNGSRTDF